MLMVIEREERETFTACNNKGEWEQEKGVGEKGGMRCRSYRDKTVLSWVGCKKSPLFF
jgi:hypothetical protein